MFFFFFSSKRRETQTQMFTSHKLLHSLAVNSVVANVKIKKRINAYYLYMKFAEKHTNNERTLVVQFVFPLFFFHYLTGRIKSQQRDNKETEFALCSNDITYDNDKISFK